MSNAPDPRPDLSPVKQALLEVRRLRERLHAYERRAHEPIAVVGIGCRYPGGISGTDAFWDVLREGRDVITEIPGDRWGAQTLYDPDPAVPGTMSTRWGGFLPEIDHFDPEFFGISDREAVTMDPQQRLLLEVTWEALEHAAIAPSALFGSPTGVFVGIGGFDYAQLQVRDRELATIDAYLATGSSHSVASGRISYVLGLKGPSIAIDTACSSSLVAIHLACQNLRSGECSLALAGGVSVILAPEWSVSLSKARMMAADGRCKVFDARADGFVRSEGCGLVVLQRLSDAVESRSRILALIRGSAVNQDGRSSGLTAPNGPSQQAAIRAALDAARVPPDAIQYVEAHGTGTALGDPIEVAALGAVYGSGRSPGDPLRIGSVKTNIGHAEAAAGVAGLIKAVLALEHERIPAHLHLSRPSPHIAWDTLRVTVPAAGEAWPRGAQPRLAGVSSFGFSGTNAHVVVQEAPASSRQRETVSAASVPAHLLAISAFSDTGLREEARRLAEYLAANPQLPVEDLAFTSTVGRSHLAWRAALVVETLDEAGEGLREIAEGRTPARGHVASAAGGPLLVAVLGGNEPGVLTSLRVCAKCNSRVRDCVDRVDTPTGAAAANGSDADRELAGTEPHTAEARAGEAAVELLGAWGIRPSLIIGHHTGAHVARSLSGGTLEALPHADPDALLPLEKVGGTLAGRGYRVVVSIGAGEAAAAVRATAGDDLLCVEWPPAAEGWGGVLSMLAALHVNGVTVDWTAVHDGRGQRVSLPARAFARRPCWYVTRPDTARPADTGAAVFEAAEGRAREQSSHLPADLELASYPAVWQALDRLSVGYMLQALQQAGTTLPGAAATAVEEAAVRCAVVPAQAALFSRCLQRLADAGLVTSIDGAIAGTRDAGDWLASVRGEGSRELRKVPELTEYVERCGSALPDVLAGRRTANDLLFGAGAGDLADRIYGSPLSRYFNALVRAAVDGVLAATSGDRVRVLEVGAGTGATTQALAPFMPSHRSQYCCTDVSPYFVQRLARRFGGLRHVSCRVLDVEQDASEHGFEPGSFDVVVASNVLHAVRDLGAVIGRLGALLGPTGVLIAYEVTEPFAWLDLTFGMFGGWHRFDDGIRHGTPTLSPEGWRDVLGRGGYDRIAVVPGRGVPAEVLGAQVLLAQRLRAPARSRTGADASEHRVASSSPAASYAPHVAGEAAGIDRRAVLIDTIRRHLGAVLSRERPDMIDRRARLVDLGLDSLMALELKDRLGQDLRLTDRLPATLVFDYPTIDAIAHLLDQLLSTATSTSSSTTAPASTLTTREAAIGSLSDADVEALLLEKLDGTP